MPDDRFLHPKAGHSEKVRSLCDFDYRVWTQYLLSADDFGVMRAKASTLMDDNEAIEARAPKVVERALQHLIDKGLVVPFTHQGLRYVCQRDWQKWQKVEYPRVTNNPKPPDDLLSDFDQSTRSLFDKHPGGNGKKRSSATQGSSDGSPNVPQIDSEESPPTRAGAPAKRLTANGSGLQAIGSEESARETGPDHGVEWAQFVAAYPEQGRLPSLLAQQRFLAARQAGVGFDVMLDALGNHKASARWRDGKIPNLLTWFEDRRWQQRLPPVSATGSGRTGAAPAGKYDGVEVE